MLINGKFEWNHNSEILLKKTILLEGLNYKVQNMNDLATIKKNPSR
jgi:hypothetical protein